MNIISINSMNVLDIVFNYTQIRWRGNFVGYDNNTLMVVVYKINEDISFNTFECLIQVSNMFARRGYKFLDVFIAYRNNNMFTRRFCGSHVNLRLELV